MLKKRSGGHELGDLVSTARNTYVNPVSVAQIDFHQSDKSNVSFSNDLMEPARAWYDQRKSQFIEPRGFIPCLQIDTVQPESIARWAQAQPRVGLDF
jgi:hypothetical protein